MTTLEHDDGVYLLDLGNGENRLHPDWIAEVHTALDEVERAEGPRALVTTAEGKIYSNGLDLDWLSAHQEQHGGYLDAVHGLYARLLSLPVITVAAIQGHAFAAGAMLTLAHDFRVMRADRGFWCLPEIDIGMSFPAGMAALVQSRLTPQVAHEAMTTGRRYGGDLAAELSIVDRAAAEAEVLPLAREIARANVAKAGATLGAIKARMYGPALAALRSREA